MPSLVGSEMCIRDSYVHYMLHVVVLSCDIAPSPTHTFPAYSRMTMDHARVPVRTDTRQDTNLENGDRRLQSRSWQSSPGSSGPAFLHTSLAARDVRDEREWACNLLALVFRSRLFVQCGMKKKKPTPKTDLSQLHAQLTNCISHKSHISQVCGGGLHVRCTAPRRAVTNTSS